MTNQTAEEAAYEAWLRESVQTSIDDPRPSIPHEVVEVNFAKRRAAALRRPRENEGGGAG